MKRVELCCHSKFDELGSVFGVDEILDCARETGAVGITDLANISAWAKLAKKAEQGRGFKLIFGLEANVQFRCGIHTVTILARNADGRNSIYRLISQSVITDEMIFDEENRNGILLGGDGELIYAMETGADDEELALLAEEYDFLLLDVCGNTPKQNIRIIEAGKRSGVPVAATCKPHYSTSGERNAWNVLMYGKNHLSNCCERHFLSDKEMLERLSYLPEQTAQEVVFTNPQLIADKCSEFPLFDGRKNCIVPGGREKLYSLCRKNAAEYYHTDEAHLPPEIIERLDREMELIGKTESYSVFLYLHQMLETLGLSAYDIRAGQLDSGLLVSFLCGITSRLPVDSYLSYYLGRRPQISVRLPSDRLEEAWKIYEKLPGICKTLPDMVFRKFPAVLKDRYISLYESENGLCFSEEERRRIEEQLDDVRYSEYTLNAKRIIIPGNICEEYLPLCKTADGKQALCFTSGDISEYFSVQLIAGSDMLMVLRKLSEITREKLGSIPFSDPKIMQLFASGEGKYPTCYGMKEFMSLKSVRIIAAAKPSCFEELVKVVGLMYGEQVWNINLEKHFVDGTVDIKTAPASPEDVFEYLISTGIDEKTSADIVHSVQMGEIERDKLWLMKEHDIPHWFIGFCERVRRMLSRATAVGIAEERWREGYFKVYYPEVYSEVMEQYEREALGNRGVRFGKTVFDSIRRREL